MDDIHFDFMKAKGTKPTVVVRQSGRNLESRARNFILDIWIWKKDGTV